MGARPQPRAKVLSLAEHFAEFRRRFIATVSVTLLLSVAGFIFYSYISRFLRAPFCQVDVRHCSFFITNPLDGLNFRVKCSAFAGFLLASPIAFWNIWRFVSPALHRNERRYALWFSIASSLFFTSGVVVAYFSFAHALHFLSSIGGSEITTIYNPNQYLNLLVLMLTLFGVSFLFPVVLVGLELIHVVSPRQLLKAWRYAIIAITIAAAVLTPSGDPLSMFAMMLPMIVFYFLAIGVGALATRHR